MLRRYAKPVCFLLVISLLLVFCKITVPYTSFPKDAVPLSEGAKDKVTVVGIAGMLSLGYDQQMGEDTSNVQSPINVATWNMTGNQVYMQPLTTLSIGCENDYRSTLSVRIDTDNELTYEEMGTVNISVFDPEGQQLYATKLLILDFQPGTAVSAAANFSIVTLDANPVFLVRVSFPTATDLDVASSTANHVPLFEYLMIKLGIVIP